MTDFKNYLVFAFLSRKAVVHKTHVFTELLLNVIQYFLARAFITRSFQSY